MDINRKHWKQIITVLALCVWFCVALQLVPHIVGKLTNYNATFTSPPHSFTTVFVKYPYCLIDPQCVNALTNNASPFEGVVSYPSVSGITVSHAKNAQAPLLSAVNFAWPNYVFFMLLLVALVVLATKFTRKYLRTGLLVFIAAWCIQETGRWEAMHEWLSPNDINASYWEFWWLLSASLAVLASVWFMTWRSVPPAETPEAG
jgi:hypothetical protein